MSTPLVTPTISSDQQSNPANETGEILLERVRKLGPLLRENADQGERDRRLPRVVFDALATSGLQRMFTPRSLGGFELDPLTAARIVEEVATFDSAAGWALQPGNTGAWWSSRLSDEGLQEIYGTNPGAMMAAAFHPPQAATPVPGGYRIKGRSPLASNIHDAEWLFLSALVMENGQPRISNGMPEVIAVVLHAREAEVVDTWHSLGMRATDSNDVVVDDVFVPATRAFFFTPSFEPNAHFRGPLYRFPAVASVNINIVGVTLGIARNAINELRTLAVTKTPLGSTKTLRERANVHSTLARAEGLLRSARAYFHETLAAAWQQTLSGSCSLEQRADVLLAGIHAVRSAVEVVDLMHTLAGTSGIYQRNKLERHLRDAHTLKHHAFASESKLETVGQVYLGLPPEFFMVGF
jgi:alkylation response protein AidB-like acyl-CoA dehydrogenase